MSKTSGIFKSQDGTSLYYETYGEGQPLLFCYGLTCRTDHWRYQLEHFSKTHQVIAFDYRGHHRSSLPLNERNLTISWCASDARDVIRHLNLKDVICFGHSFGVAVALELAQLDPGLVRGLVLICGSVTKPFRHMFHSDKMDNVFKLTSFLYQMAPLMVSRTWQYFTDANWFSYFLTARFGFNAELSSEEDILGYLRGVHEAPFQTFHNLAKDYSEYDARDRLAEVRCPTFVIAGAEDAITPFYLQEEMADLLPKGELHRIEGGSHNTHMDFSDEVNVAVESFIKRNEFV